MSNISKSLLLAISNFENSHSSFNSDLLYQFFHELFIDPSSFTIGEISAVLSLTCISTDKMFNNYFTPKVFAKLLLDIRHNFCSIDKLPPNSTSLSFDMVGTGGDGQNIYNISSTVCLLLAQKFKKICGKDITIFKIGNNSSSRGGVGSADFLHYLLEREKIDNFHFLWARQLFPTFGHDHIKTVRNTLPFKTIFNLFGPLLNVMNVDYRVLGVLYEEVGELFCQVLINNYEEFKFKRIMIICGNGIDKVQITGDSILWEISYEEGKCLISKRIITYRDFGLDSAPRTLFYSGTLEENVSTFDECKSPEFVTFVSANLAIGLYCILKRDLVECFNLAKTFLE